MAVRRLALVLALSCTASAQNPWVNRRKNKDKDAPVAADPAAGDTDFSKLNDMVKNLQQAGAAGGQGEDMFAGMGADSASVSERFRTSSCVDGVGATSRRRDALDVAARAATRLAREYVHTGDMWESLMDSPEMEEMLANPELLKATIKNNPLINAIPGP